MPFGPEGLYTEANLAILFRTLKQFHPLAGELPDAAERVFRMHAAQVYPNPAPDRQASIHQAVDRAATLLGSAVEIQRLYHLNQGLVDLLFRLGELVNVNPDAIPAIAGPFFNGDNPLEIRLPVVPRAAVLAASLAAPLFDNGPQGLSLLVNFITAGAFGTLSGLALSPIWWASVVPLDPDVRDVAGRTVKAWRDVNPAAMAANDVSILQAFSTDRAFEAATPAARDARLKDAEELLSPLGADWSVYSPASRSIAKVAVLRAYLNRLSSVLGESYTVLAGV